LTLIFSGVTLHIQLKKCVFGTDRTVFGAHSKVNDNTNAELCVNNLALPKSY
jgi:hypothetical protein